eukprot:evm.model.scf_1182.1 EVM.evm.TU.scf_1182.1   scf_1182:7992-10578(-)
METLSQYQELKTRCSSGNRVGSIPLPPVSRRDDRRSAAARSARSPSQRDCSEHKAVDAVSRRTVELGVLSTGLLGWIGQQWAVADAAGSRQVFMDVEVDRKELGRIVVELLDGESAIGCQRFADLAVGIAGVGYRLSKFDDLADNFIRNEGVRRLTYSATQDSPIAGGDSVQDLLAELEKSSRTHNEAGLVSIIVRDDRERQIKARLIAKGGKLVTVEDEIGARPPNGTAFTITTAPAPELDGKNLVIGRVVSGMNIVREIQALPTVTPNSGSPFF